LCRVDPRFHGRRLAHATRWTRSNLGKHLFHQQTSNGKISRYAVGGHYSLAIFGSAKAGLRVAHERLTRICFNDYDPEIALAAIRQAPDTKEDEIMGVGRLMKLDGVNEVEFAIVISDRFQRQGLGTRLLRLLVDIGRKEGDERSFGQILPDIMGEGCGVS
jgi:GNAT superfamily N-acetyltransferase